MKLIIREYLASLRERGELDAVIPDLLSQMGMNVFSRPGRGTRQDGVDVAAAGKLEDKTDRVYLFAIKPGNLTRKDWAASGVQDLRPTIVEILDAFIPNRLPTEHRDKEIVICICVGGDFEEQVVPQITGFTKQHERENVSFQLWNGDKLAGHIQKNLLREDLLPRHARSHLRKSIAMLDEPDASYKYFSMLLHALTGDDLKTDKRRVRAVRQISICIWMLNAWGKEVGNIESPYRSSELALLHAWQIASRYVGRRSKAAHAVFAAFFSALGAYENISTEYLHKCVLPHTEKRDGISSAVRASTGLDINLAMFDILGRTALKGIWAYWAASQQDDQLQASRELSLRAYHQCAGSVKAMISNNPALFLPAKDRQAVDISLAVFLLGVDARNWNDIQAWLSELTNRAAFAFEVHGSYPCTLENYGELLERERRRDDQYRQEITNGTILYPLISFWAAIFGFEELYADIAALKEKHFQHCTFQFWYPDELSDEHIYTNSATHGAALTDIPVERPAAELLALAFEECDQHPQFDELSAVKAALWPLVAIACRHHRLPLPLHLFKAFAQVNKTDEDGAHPQYRNATATEVTRLARNAT